jgi:hypothetical protein
MKRLWGRHDERRISNGRDTPRSSPQSPGREVLTDMSWLEVNMIPRADGPRSRGTIWKDSEVARRHCRAEYSRNGLTSKTGRARRIGSFGSTR